MTGAKRHYDVEAIKDALTVPELLEQAGIPLDHRDLRRRSTTCPIHGGANPGAFTWYDDGRRWHCFSGCGTGGDVIALIMKLKSVDFKAAVRAAAVLAGVETDVPPNSVRLEQLRQSPLRRMEERTRQDERRRIEAIEVATARWLEMRGPKNVEAGRKYLRTRGLEPVIDDVNNPLDVVTFLPDGSTCTPIYSFERGGHTGLNAVVNVATRRVQGEPKVLVMKGAPTHGTFGRSAALAGRPIERVVLVEGVADFLTALITFEHDDLAVAAPVAGDHLVLGAHSASGLPKIVAALGDDREVGARFRRLPLVLVTHQDGPGGAGAHAQEKVMAEAEQRGMSVSVFDLAGHKDLNDWYRANVTYDPKPRRASDV